MSRVRCLQLAVKLIGFFLVAFLAQGDVPDVEREALIALYDSTGGDFWFNNSNWLGPPGSENTWFGVTTDGNNTTVTRISISRNNLVGLLPAQLGHLSNLEILTLDSNKLSGSIPAELFVEKSRIRFIGNIPVFDTFDKLYRPIPSKTF
jgi:Leucine-rich repeat (LRR) protein